MSKKALKKDFRVEVKKSRNRFVSILFIVAMGAAMFAGIHSSAPDMRYTSDEYYDGTNLMDIRVVGTLGITDGDIQALGELEGVQTVEPGYMTDVLCQEKVTQTVLHMESMLETINQLMVTEGRLPEKRGECFLDQEYLAAYGYQVGDYIEVILPDEEDASKQKDSGENESDGQEASALKEERESEAETEETEEDTPVLRTTRFQIVGTGHSSSYVSYNRGSSSVGSGEVAGFLYILPEDFDSEVYMAAYMVVEGAMESVAYTAEYERLIEEVLERAEGIQDIRCDIRYHEVVEEAQATLDEHKADLAEGESELENAKKELEDGKKEAESELAKAKADLESGESELEEGRQELQEKEQELEDAKQQIAEGEAEIAQQEAALWDAKQQLADGESQLASAEKTLKQKQLEYDSAEKSAKKKLEEGQKELDAARGQVDAGFAQMESESQRLEAAIQQSSEAAQTLEAAQAEYDGKAETATQELDAGQKEIDAAKAQIDAGLAQLESESQKLDAAVQQSSEAAQTLSASQAQYEAGMTALAEGETAYSENKAEAEEGWAKYNGALSAYEQKKAEYDSSYAARQEEIAGLQSQKEAAAAQASVQNAVVSELKGQNGNLESQIASLNGEVQNLNGTISGLQSEIGALKQSVSDKKAALEAEEGKENGGDANQIEALKTEISTLESQIQEKENALNTANSDLSGKQNLISELTQTKSDNETKLAEAESLAAAAQGEADRLSGLITEKTTGLENEAAELTAAEQQLAATKAELEAGDTALVSARAELDATSAELAAAKEQLDVGWAELAAGEEQIAAGRQQLEASRQQLEAGQQEIAANQQKIDAGRQELASAKEQLDAGWAELAAGQEQIEAGRQQLEAGRQELEAGQQEIEANQKKLDEGKAELASGKSQLDAAWKEINSNKSNLASSRAKLEDGEAQLSQGKQTLADSKVEISDGEQQIADAWEEIGENEQKIKDGWVEYEEGKAEAESEILDGEEKIKEAESELADARVKLADAQKEIDEIEAPEWYVNDRAVNPEYSGYGENADRIRNIGKVFPVLFFLVAALISLTTMTRMVEEQRTQIGTLKALGYSKFSIASKYMKYALYATLGGSLAGVLIGEKIFPYIIVWAYGMMYPNLRSPVIPYNWEYGLMATGAALVCTLGATFCACCKELAATPAVLMRPPAPKEGKRVLLERIPFIWRHLNFTWKSTIRNLFRYKKRFFMTIAGIGGCMALLLLGFGLKDSIVGIGELQYDQLQTYDLMAILDADISQEDKVELTAYLNDTVGEEGQQRAHIQMISVTDGKKEYTPYLYVLENTEDLDNFLVFRDRISHETYSLSDEGAIVTEKLAAMLGLEEGDDLVISDDDRGMLTVPIVHITENYLSHYVYLTPAVYEQVYDEPVEYNGLLISCQSSREEPSASDSWMENEEEVQRIGEQILTMDGALNVTYSHSIADQLADQLASMDLIIGVLIICAGMLAFVVLYNLNNININERKRELATLKVLGFHNSEVAAYVYRENILLTAIGAVVGLGMGSVLHRFVITTVEVDNCMFGRIIDPMSFLYGTLFTFAFSAIVNWFMYFKLKKIDMVESLKSVE